MNLLEAKIYYDGSNWIAIPHTERPYRQRRRRITQRLILIFTAICKTLSFRFP